MIPMFTKQSGRDWQDGVYVTMMAEELVKRGTDLADPTAVTAALHGANFSTQSIDRLLDRAIAAAEGRRHAA